VVNEVKAMLHMRTGLAGLVEARAEFQRAHARAKLRGAIDRFFHRCGRLCSLTDAVEEAGRAVPRSADAVRTNRRPNLIPGPRRLRDVELEQIIGSLDRAEDYTGDFLPRVGTDEERWARVRVALDSLEGVPPIELYEYDGEYYVKDGHHRVSVMKRIGVKRVEAYVTRLVPVG
jgi:uncharacterized ParB-like nuclease family protein